MKKFIILLSFLLLLSCETLYIVKPDMGIQIYDEKQNVIYVPDNEKENKADGSVLEKRHLEKAKKHCLKYGKYPELVESNNIIKPYYEIYKCNKYK